MSKTEPSNSLYFEDSGETWYSFAGAVEYLRINPNTLRYHIGTLEDLVVDKKLGKLLLFKRSTLDAFKQNYTPRPSGWRAGRSRKNAV